MSVPNVSGRSSGRLNSAGASNLLRGSRSPISDNDSLRDPLIPLRVGVAQAESVIASLTLRELAVVADVGRLRIVSGDQLVRLHFGGGGRRHGRRVLASLTERRVLARLGRSIGGVHAGSAGFVYRLDVIGQRLTDPGAPTRKPWTPSFAYLAHAVMVSECFVRLTEASRTGTFELLQFDGEPACWRWFVGRSGSRQTIKPDAHLRIGLGEFEDSWFLECDRATEEPARIIRKCEVYTAYWRTGRESVFPRVLWVATRHDRALGLLRSLRRLSDADRQLFSVCELNEFVSVIAAGAAGEEGGSS